MAETEELMKKESSPRGGARPHRVLIIEDDAVTHVFYKAMFRRHKELFSCRFEKSAVAALERMRGGGIEAVVLDWDRPGINGISLLKDIRAHSKTRGIRVMVVSGRARAEDQVRALDSGADDYLMKPFQVEVFMARLRAVLRR